MDAKLIDQIRQLRARQAKQQARATGAAAGVLGRSADPMGTSRRVAAYRKLGRPGATPRQRRRLAKHDSSWKAAWAPSLWPELDD